MAQSRMKRLEKIVIVPEVANDPQFFWSFPEPDFLPGPLIQFIDVSFGYKPDNILYQNLSFTLDMESRIVLVGANGKTVFLGKDILTIKFRYW